MPNNHFTTHNLAASDVVLDNPSAGSNFCTLNPLDGNGTFSEGNLEVVTPASGYSTARSTFFCPSGTKWYWEFVPTTGYAYAACGITTNSHEHSINPGAGNGAASGHGVGIYNTEIDVDNSRSGAVLTAWASGNIIGFTYDVDENELKYYINGILNYTYSSVPVSTDGDYSPSFGDFGGAVASTINVNFGQDSSFGGIKTAQGNADGNGKGDFYYTPPTGFLALCTANLPTPTIKKPAEHFDVLTYTANGTAGRSLTGLGHQPDLLWAKERNAVAHHVLLDSVRTASAGRLSSNRTNTEDATTALASFDANGFTVGSSAAYLNSSTTNYVAWSWKKSTTAGFGISTWTGTGEMDGDTIDVAHGCGGTPELVIAKDRDYGQDWIVWHHKLSADSFLILNENYSESTWDEYYPLIEAGATDNTFGIDTSASSMSLNDGEYGGGGETTYVAYSMRSIEGYSLVGSYVGNGSADGPFVSCSFRPAMIFLKDIDADRSWFIFDDQRSTYNVVDETLKIDSSAAETSVDSVDFVSNGFKIRHNSSSSSINDDDHTLIFYAVAEKPLKYASAR